MTWRQLPNAENMSEFVPAPSLGGAHRHATCGEDALLGGLHCLYPARWPMNGAALDELTRTMQAHTFPDGTRWADVPQGASTMSGLANMLTLLGVPHTRHDPSELHQLLEEWAGIKPVMIEFANAQALPGDEAGVHYHYHCCVAGDPEADTYGDVDGDSYAVRVSHGLGPLNRVTWRQMQAGQPYTVLVIEGGAHVGVPAGWTDSAGGDPGTFDGVLTVDGVSCIHGIRKLVLEWPGGWAPENIPLNAEYSRNPVEPGNPALGAGVRQEFRGFAGYPCAAGWTEGKGVYVIWAGQDLVALFALVDHLQAQLAALQASEGPGDVLDDPANRASFRASLIEARSNAQKLLDELTAAANSIPA